MKRISNWFHNISLSKKLIIVFLGVGIIPLVITFALSMGVLRKKSSEWQMYSVNQGYEQVYTSLQDCVNRLLNLSTLIVVNDTINSTFKIMDNEMDLIAQLPYFDNISSYSYALELAFDLDNIIYYINDDFLIAKEQSGRYRKISIAQETDWYQQLMANNGRPTWVSFSDSPDADTDEYIAITRAIRNENNFSETIGILAVLIEREYIQSILINTEKSQLYYLESSDGNILTTSNDLVIYEPILDKIRIGKDNRFRHIDLNGREYFIRSQQLEGTDLCLTSIIPSDAISAAFKETNMQMGIMYAVVSFLLVVLIYPLTKSITYRVQLLRNQMLLVETGNIQTLDIETHTDEIGQLISSYNAMVKIVDRLMEQQYVMGQEKIGAELKALQSQINPHFLYNTLDMINWMAQKNEIENISEVIQAMSMFYRLSLSKGKDIITIHDEIKMCQAYMEIQNKRFRGKIQFEEEIQEEILDYLIPKITLQPFIENAIIHGISENEDGRGLVILKGWMDDMIHLSVIDNGQGMSENPKSNSRGSQYGMLNIEKRLSLFFGNKISIEVESTLGIGTSVTIHIPPIKD